MIEVVSLSGSLTYAGEHGISAVLRCDVTDQLLNQHGLSNARTAEQSDLSALLIRTQKVYHLDTCFQQLLLCGLLHKFRCRSVYGFIAHSLGSGLVVNRLAQHVKNTSQSVFPNRYADGRSLGNRFHASYKSVRGAHGNTSHRIVAQMLRNLHRKLTAVFQRHFYGFVNFRQSVAELQVKHGAHDLCDLTKAFIHSLAI